MGQHDGVTREREVRTSAGTLRVDAGGATLDGEPLRLSPVPLALLRALVEAGGDVVDRARLLGAMPGARDLHAVDVAVARLRTAIGRPGVVGTVVRRGYRLDVPDR